MMGVRSIRHHSCNRALRAAADARSAQAQQEPALGAEGPHSNAPVDVTADRIEVQDRADRAIFAGNVHVDAGRADARHRSG